MNRRIFIKRFLGVIKAGALGLFLYQPLSFIIHKIPRLPVKVRVRTQPEKDMIIIENDFFLAPDPEKPSAISRKCTHLGCRVNYSEKDDLLVCPCHGSRFAVGGKVLHGPAQKDLPELPVSFSGEKGYIVTLEDAT